jgi:hypothetical protein
MSREWPIRATFALSWKCQAADAVDRTPRTPVKPDRRSAILSESPVKSTRWRGGSSARHRERNSHAPREPRFGVPIHTVPVGPQHTPTARSAEMGSCVCSMTWPTHSYNIE